MPLLAVLLLASAPHLSNAKPLATPPDFSSAGNLTVLAPDGGMAETSMALSGTRVVMGVMKRNAPRAIAIFVSNDSGTTWSSAPDRETSIGGKTYAYAWDPWLTVLDDGSFGLTYLLSAEGQPTLGDMAIVYERSLDGRTWSAPVVMDSAPSPNYVDKPTVTFDRAHATVYLTWTRLTAVAGSTTHTSAHVVAASTDRGATWQTRTVMNDQRDGWPQSAVTADGTVVYTVSDRLSSSYLSNVSTDGAASFSNAQVIVKGGLWYTTPAAAAAFAAWMQNVTAHGNNVYVVSPMWEGVYFSRSTDAGQTWSTPLHLAGRFGGAVRPSVAVDDATGNIIVCWLDAKDDPNSVMYRLYAAQSDDGGATFSTPAAFSPPFAVDGNIGDFNSTIVFRKGSAVTAFSTAGGYLTAARVILTPPAPRRRAARP